MKIILLLMLVVSMTSMAQQNSTSRQQQAETINYFLRIGVDFEIKDNPTPDPDLIQSIQFDQYNRQRHATLDLEFLDPTTNYIIILYSEEKCKLNKH